MMNLNNILKKDSLALRVEKTDDCVSFSHPGTHCFLRRVTTTMRHPLHAWYGMVREWGGEETILTGTSLVVVDVVVVVLVGNGRILGVPVPYDTDHLFCVCGYQKNG